MSVRARAQAGAKGPPSGLAHPRALGHRPPGPCRGREGGSAGCGRPRGGGFCGRPPRPRGGEERHREAWVPGMGRYGTGPQPGQQIWDSPGGGRHQNRRARPPPCPRPPETAGTLTWLRWAARTSHSPCTGRCPARSRRSCRGHRRCCPPLPLLRRLQPRRPAPPLASWAPPPALPLLPHPWRRSRLAPPSRLTGQAGGWRRPPA